MNLDTIYRVLRQRAMSAGLIGAVYSADCADTVTEAMARLERALWEG